MSISNVKAPDSHVRLMTAIGEAIRIHTMISPLPAEDIVGILGFSAGAAIANAQGKTPHKVGTLRQMCVANIDQGIQQFLTQPTSPILLPN